MVVKELRNSKWDISKFLKKRFFWIAVMGGCKCQYLMYGFCDLNLLWNQGEIKSIWIHFENWKYICWSNDWKLTSGRWKYLYALYWSWWNGNLSYGWCSAWNVEYMNIFINAELQYKISIDLWFTFRERIYMNTIIIRLVTSKFLWRISLYIK